MTFGERLDKLLDEKRLTGLQLAEKLGVSQGAVSNWLHGTYPTADKACKIARVLNVTVEHLVNGEPELPPVPSSFVVSEIQSTTSKRETSSSGLMHIPPHLESYGKNIRTLLITGDSMEPTLANGDSVVCDNCGYDGGEGLYVIEMNGNGYVRRIQVLTDRLVFKTDNSKYDAIEELTGEQKVRVIGKVHYVVRKISD